MNVLASLQKAQNPAVVDQRTNLLTLYVQEKWIADYLACNHHAQPPLQFPFRAFASHLMACLPRFLGLETGQAIQTGIWFLFSPRENEKHFTGHGCVTFDKICPLPQLQHRLYLLYNDLAQNKFTIIASTSTEASAKADGTTLISPIYITPWLLRPAWRTWRDWIWLHTAA